MTWIVPAAQAVMKYFNAGPLGIGIFAAGAGLLWTSEERKIRIAPVQQDPTGAVLSTVSRIPALLPLPLPTTSSDSSTQTLATRTSPRQEDPKVTKAATSTWKQTPYSTYMGSSVPQGPQWRPPAIGRTGISCF